MKRQLPFALTTLRLLLGPVALACAFTSVSRLIFVPLLLLGTLSDIFDGILARRFGVATARLRRYDSITDVIYYLFILAATWRLCRSVVVQNIWAIGIIVLSEIIVVMVCFARFKKYPATHSWLAKFYGLCLLFCLIALLAFAAGSWPVILLLIVALLTNSEIIAIHLLAKKPPVDVGSIFIVLKRTQRE